MSTCISLLFYLRFLVLCAICLFAFDLGMGGLVTLPACLLGCLSTSAPYSDLRRMFQATCLEVFKLWREHP